MSIWFKNIHSTYVHIGHEDIYNNKNNRVCRFCSIYKQTNEEMTAKKN